MRSAPAIGFEYRPSRLLRHAVATAAVLAALAVMLSGLALVAKGCLLGVVVLAAGCALRRMARPSLAAAGWNADGSWSLRTIAHDDLPATLVAFRVLGGFIVLRLRTAEHGTHALLLAPDNSDADIRRRLRMRLATAQPAAGDGAVLNRL